ncbi:MAG: hypothetical protein ACI8S3_002452, partial [Alphaproteobacteria bacterium]
MERPFDEGFMSGISVADGQDIIDTRMAPWVKELCIRVEETSDSGAVLRMPYGEHLARHGGVISGQSMLAFADSAMVVVISSALGGYRNMATVDMTTSFMTAAYNCDIVGRGEIVKAGKRMVFGQFRLEDAASGTP